MTIFSFRMAAFCFKMVFFWLEKAVYATNSVFLGGSCGVPPLVWPLSLLNGPPPHKEFNPKIAAVLLENLGSKRAWKLPFLAFK